MQHPFTLAPDELRTLICSRAAMLTQGVANDQFGRDEILELVGRLHALAVRLPLPEPIVETPDEDTLKREPKPNKAIN
jgi:hypothetical protein